MKILIPGGAGYIGSVLTPFLLEKGYQVTVVDRFIYERNSLAGWCHLPNFRLVNGDLRNQNLMEKLVNEADALIPLAALVGAPLCDRDPFSATQINLDATVKLIQMTPENKVIIMPTTNSAYGTGDANNLCSEKSPLRPISQYAREKVEVEKELMKHPRSVSFRLATVFGMSPRMRTDLLVNDFVYKAVHEKSALLFEAHYKRNFIHIRDVARAFEHALIHIDTMKGEIYNIGLSNANLSKRELAEKIKEHIPGFVFIEAPIGKDPDQRNYIVSNEKIQKTGFRPIYSIDDGIIELIKGYSMIKKTEFSNV